MAEMINITFPDGNSRKYDKGVNGLAIANSISTSLAKNSIAIKLNGEIVDLARKKLKMILRYTNY
jgi:TGS domain.